MKEWKLKKLKEIKELKKSRQSEINGPVAQVPNGYQHECKSRKLRKLKQSGIKVDSDVDVINLRALAGPPKIRKPL